MDKKCMFFFKGKAGDLKRAIEVKMWEEYEEQMALLLALHGRLLLSHYLDKYFVIN